MKGQFWSVLRKAPGLRRRDILAVLLPTLIWGAMIYSRPQVIQLRCAETPAACNPERLFLPDQFSVHLQSDRADAWSFKTQNFTGILALLAPLIWGLLRVARRKLPPVAAIRALGVDWVLLIQTTLWNGTVTEGIRLIVQRPRPFVYADPGSQGANPAHYTSFISGHTSFTAAAGTGLVLALAGRGAPTWLLALTSLLVASLVFLTGTFRVLAGRHFPTDVLAAALAGALIGWLVAWVHRDQT